MNKIEQKIQKARKAVGQGLLPLAIDHLSHALEYKNDHFPCLIMRGELYLRLGDYERALHDYAQAIQIESTNVVALNNFGAALLRCGKREEAKKIFEYLLEVQSDNFDALLNLGAIYNEMKQHEVALQYALKAIQVNPSSSIAFNNLGAAFGELMMLQEAEEAYKTAYALDKKSVISLINLAQIQEKQDNFSAAANSYEEILGLKHASPTEIEIAKYFLSYSYLYFGDLRKGWEYYELGFSSSLPPGSLRSARRFTQPKWKGENIEGKRLLLWSEQGIGDEIMFSTCFHEVENLGASVVLECEPRLVGIFQRAFPSFEVREPLINVERFSAINDFDLHCPFGSLLPLFRGQIEDFARFNKTISPKQEYQDLFRKRLVRVKDKILIGICWRSGMLSASRNLHYTALVDWHQLLTDPRFQLVNLQYGDCEKELNHVEEKFGINIIRWDDVDLKNDLEKVWALISVLDCVVTTGTAVCQMAGAINQKTYLLIRPDWSMLGVWDKYIWYPSVVPLTSTGGALLAENFSKLVPLIKSDFPADRM